MEAYQEESREIMRIVAGTGALVEQMSIDEAYADLSALCQADDLEAIHAEMNQPLPEPPEWPS